MENKMFMLASLNCPVCAAKLEKAARQLAGMKAARVEFGSGTLHTEYDGNLLTVEAIRDLIKRTGLEVSAVVTGRPGR